MEARRMRSALFVLAAEVLLSCSTFGAQRFLWFEHVNGTATLLPDGRVLLAGWQSPRGPKSAEWYDPKNNAFARAADMPTPRTFDPVSTLLKDGRVLLVGGFSPKNERLETIDAYDPKQDTWKVIGKIPEQTIVSDAVALTDSTVLITTWVGGKDGILIFSPEDGSVKSVGHPKMACNGTALATPLRTGKVLITHLAYGDGDPNAFLYDPAQAKTSTLPRMAKNRDGHQAILLPDGRVLVTGGDEGAPTAEIYDPDKNAFTPASPMVAPRTMHRAVALSDGRVLIVGGITPIDEEALKEVEKQKKGSGLPMSKPLAAEVEVYDPKTDKFSALKKPPSNPQFWQGSRTGVYHQLAGGEILFMSFRGPIYFDPKTESWRLP